MNVLFVCTENKFRSRTAETVFTGRQGLAVRSAGTSSTAVNPVTAELLQWADVVFVMEHEHRNRLRKKFRTEMAARRVVVLGVPDEYDYMDPELVGYLDQRVSNLLGVTPVR